MVALGIGLAAVAGLIVSGIYYAVAPAAPAVAGAELPKRAALLQVVVELLRSAAVACLIAGLMVSGNFGGPGAGAFLGLALWVLPLVLLVGSVFHEHTPVRVAALHAGDWLLKLVAIGVVVGFFV